MKPGYYWYGSRPYLAIRYPDGLIEFYSDIYQQWMVSTWSGITKKSPSFEFIGPL